MADNVILMLQSVKMKSVFIYFIYLFIQGFVQSSTTAKTIGHKSPTKFKLQPNPLLK